MEHVDQTRENGGNRAFSEEGCQQIKAKIYCDGSHRQLSSRGTN